jgi:hypothetical protein
MEHCDKKGKSKVLPACTLPITGLRVSALRVGMPTWLARKHTPHGHIRAHAPTARHTEAHHGCLFSWQVVSTLITDMGVFTFKPDGGAPPAARIWRTRACDALHAHAIRAHARRWPTSGVVALRWVQLA